MLVRFSAFSRDSAARAACVFALPVTPFERKPFLFCSAQLKAGFQRCNARICESGKSSAETVDDALRRNLAFRRVGQDGGGRQTRSAAVAAIKTLRFIRRRKMEEERRRNLRQMMPESNSKYWRVIQHRRISGPTNRSRAEQKAHRPLESFRG